MRLPWELERTRLVTALCADECRRRLTDELGGSGGLTASEPGRRSVRGWIGGRSFYLGRAGGSQPGPRTWLRGRIVTAPSHAKTRIELVIGPNPWLGFVTVALFALLMAGALELSVLAATTSLAVRRQLVLAWAVIISYAGLFFIVPELDYGRERAFLVGFVRALFEGEETEDEASAAADAARALNRRRRARGPRA